MKALYVSPKTKVEIGKTYGDLTVISFSHRNIVNNIYKNYFDVKCSCGNYTKVLSYNLCSGNTKSCGCVHAVHKMCSHPIYSNYNQIMQRCYNTKCKNYKNYGGRGIKMYSKWKNRPDLFIKYVENTCGPKSHDKSIDRIDNNKGYMPGNLRWATQEEQKQNTRKSVVTKEIAVLIYKDFLSKKYSQIDLSKKYNCSKHTIYQIVHKKQWKNATVNL